MPTSCKLPRPPAFQTFFIILNLNADHIKPGVEVFQVWEAAETFTIKEQMLVQHLVAEHRDYHSVCDSDREGDFGGDMLKWYSIFLEVICKWYSDLIVFQLTITGGSLGS